MYIEIVKRLARGMNTPGLGCGPRNRGDEEEEEEEGEGCYGKAWGTGGKAALEESEGLAVRKTEDLGRDLNDGGSFGRRATVYSHRLAGNSCLSIYRFRRVLVNPGFDEKDVYLLDRSSELLLYCLHLDSRCNDVQKSLSRGADKKEKIRMLTC